VSRRSAAERLRADGQPIGEVYLEREEIAARVAELGREIAAAYTGRMPLLVAPLKSSTVFLADLSHAANADAQVIQHALCNGHKFLARCSDRNAPCAAVE